MHKNYTEEWNGFQFCSPTYLDGHFDTNRFNLVKWVDCEPYEAYEWGTGYKKMFSRYCFVVGWLSWNFKEPCFEFESCGLRYLEHRIDGLEEFVLKFAEEMGNKLLEDET